MKKKSQAIIRKKDCQKLHNDRFFILIQTKILFYCNARIALNN